MTGPDYCIIIPICKLVRNNDDLMVFFDLKSELVAKFIRSTIENNIHDQQPLLGILNKVIDKTI